MAKKRLLDRIKDELAKEGLVARTNAARKWLANKVREIRMPGGAKHAFVNASNKSKPASGLEIGKMYFYFYNPKTKDTLPYYDTFPLVIPVDFVPANKSASGRDAGFLGLNLHYIHPKYRLILLDKLNEIYSDDRFDNRTKMRISYNWLKANKKVFEATPCLKWYLFPYVESRVLEISADEWDICALLPFETFKKQSQVRVWADSRKKF